MLLKDFSLFWPTAIYGIIIFLICFLKSSRNLYKRVLYFGILKNPRVYLLMIIAFVIVFFISLASVKVVLFSESGIEISDLPLTFLLSKSELYQFIIFTLLIAPIMEELIFRAPLFIWINKTYYFVVSLLTSSIIFAVLHPTYPILGFGLGIILGLTIKLTKSIVPAIIIHCVWNLFTLFYYNYI